MKYIVLFFILFSNFSLASDLKTYCDDDPTGELYSEIWDNDIEDGFSVIGLNPSNYITLIDKYEDDDLFDMAEKTIQSHPEISKALYIWKLETCIDRGYQMMTGQL